MPYSKLQPRIVIYTHDTFGLGHVRRSLNIIRNLAKELPHATILLITGSHALSFLKELPPNVDFMKIPTAARHDAAGKHPPHLSIGLPEIILLRSAILKETVLNFKPDIFLVDNFPLGSRNELLPLLQKIDKAQSKTILGLRDIFDDSETVKRGWKKSNTYNALDRYYDKILIYGIQRVFDPIKAYEIPESIASKIHFCGYLTSLEPITKTTEEIRKELDVDGPVILANGMSLTQTQNLNL